MAAYDYRATDDFIDAYESLDNDTAAVLDEAVTRLLEEHAGAWARQGRVVGEHGDAWIVEIRTKTSDVSLYWDYLDDQLILLVLLIVRPA